MDFLKRLFGSDLASINATQYEQEYFKKNNHVLIDVRTAQEFKGGHIQGAKNIPLHEVAGKLKQIPRDKTVVVVCQSGSRSKSACRMLKDAGYENVINLSGGTFGWRMKGKPVS